MENEDTFSYEEFYDMYNKMSIDDQNLFFEIIICMKKFGDKFSNQLEAAMNAKDLEAIKQIAGKQATVGYQPDVWKGWS